MKFRSNNFKKIIALAFFLIFSINSQATLIKLVWKNSLSPEGIPLFKSSIFKIPKVLLYFIIQVMSVSLMKKTNKFIILPTKAFHLVSQEIIH